MSIKNKSTDIILCSFPVLYSTSTFLFSTNSIFYIIWFFLLSYLTIFKYKFNVIFGSLIHNLFPFFMFAIFAFLSGIWSLDPLLSIKRSVAILIYLYTTAVAIEHSRRYILNVKRYPDWIGVMVRCLPILLGFMFVYVFMKNGTIRLSKASPAHVSFSNAFTAQVILCVPFIIRSLFICLQKNFKHQLIINLLILIVSAYIVIVSQSRAALILFIFILVLVPVELIFRKKYKKIFLILFILFTFSSFLYYYGLNINNHISNNQIISPTIHRIEKSNLLFGSKQQDGGDQCRIDMYVDIIDILKQHPILGIGFEAYHEYNYYNYVSHTILLSSAEIGIIGIFIFLWIILFVARRIIHNLFYLHRLPFTNSIKNVYISALIAVLVGFAHAFFRPQLQNPVIYLIISIVLLDFRSIINRH